MQVQGRQNIEEYAMEEIKQMPKIKLSTNIIIKRPNLCLLHTKVKR